jgi:hypothetical protein
VLLIGSLTVWFEGNARTFLRTLITLWAFRLVFALLDALGRVLWWRLYMRQRSPALEPG